ncbi:hypothetical protein BSL78_18542 [Apostichopus japonicus]|uniref:Protein kinase domain-containing protein n=1 Tax=Stichopus japonicus TaxID=307972 RepID=A0A2G8K9D2_STIJA|nr:hypothetical protein BSL78_18542 [Apostichopus japonicus]
MQSTPSLSSKDMNRIAELENVITKLQEQILMAERKEQALRTAIDIFEAKSKKKPLLDSLNESLREEHEPGWTELLDCRAIDSIKIAKNIAEGHTKTVQEGELMGKRVAVKSASIKGKDVKRCLEDGLHKKDGECYLLANYKVLKEIMVLRQLNHRNIANLLGMCVRSENSSPAITERGVTLVVEIGEPVQLHKLMEMDWPSRVQICIQLAALLEYLAESSMGSIALPDVRDEQFVMIDNTIKLTDVDDIFATEPNCDNSMKCLLDGKETGIKCGSSKKCNGLNAFSNLQRLMAVFFAPLLKEGCPTEKQEEVDAILNKVKNGEMDAGSMEILLQGFLK